jgi:hypothetical protein
MGVRTLDSARGLWLSPDLYIGQNFQLLFKLSDEANLFQYSGNNPILINDPSGESKIKAIGKFIKTGDVTLASYEMANGIARRANDALNQNASIDMKVYSAACIAFEVASPIGCDEIEVASAFIHNAISSNSHVAPTAPEIQVQSIAPKMGLEVNPTKSKKSPIHHIATDKNNKQAKGGGPWTPRFRDLFSKAGMRLSDPANKIEVPGHVGGILQNIIWVFGESLKNL